MKGVLLHVTLMCAVAAASAHAQPPDQVSIGVQGVPPGTQVELFVSGANSDRTFVGGAGTIASNFMSDGKTVDIVVDRCMGSVSVSVLEDWRLPPPDDPDCDRTITSGRWTAGAHLVIDATRGTIVTAPTIATRGDIQSAARTARDALSAGPTLAPVDAALAAIAQLPTVPDAELGTWIRSFSDHYLEIGRRGGDTKAVGAMGDLLNVMSPMVQSPATGTTAASTSQTPASPLGGRQFRIDLLSERSTELVDPSSTPRVGRTSGLSQVSMSGRIADSRGGPIIRENVTWYYSLATSQAVGYTEPDSTGSRSVYFANPLRNSLVAVDEFRVIVGSRAPDLGTLGFGAVPAQIIGNVWPLLSLFERSFARVLAPGSARTSSPMISFPSTRVDQRGQNQGSEPPSSPAGPRRVDVRPPRLLLAARSFVDTLRQMFVPTFTSAAITGPGVQLVIGPSGRREYWIDPMRSRSAHAQAEAAREIPRPSLKVYIRSLGRSTGEDAQQAILINDGNVPVRVVEGESFATEPLEGVSEQTFSRELERYAGRPRMTMNLTSYCLNFEKAAPTKGQIFRLAATAAQDRFGPVRRILRAAVRVRDRGELRPDGDPNLYFHSIRQWAIWTVEKGFNERAFAEALLEYTKKNVVAAGRRWTKEFEAAARSIIPNRWQDVQRVLAAAQQGI